MLQTSASLGYATPVDKDDLIECHKSFDSLPVHTSFKIKQLTVEMLPGSTER